MSECALILMRTEQNMEVIPAAKMVELFPNTTEQTWAGLRHKGTGPRYIKVMRRVYYRRVDIEAWLEANVMERTDRPVSA